VQRFLHQAAQHDLPGALEVGGHQRRPRVVAVGRIEVPLALPRASRWRSNEVGSAEQVVESAVGRPQMCGRRGLGST
jgi:hypothetical protein